MKRLSTLFLLTLTILVSISWASSNFYQRKQPPTQTKPAPACCEFNLDLSTGQDGGPRDLFWTLPPKRAYITPNSGSWIDLPPAKWIQPSASPTPDYNIPIGLYKYTMTFDVPACTGGVSLSGKFAGDNSATAFLDGNPIAGAACPGPKCFYGPLAPIPLNVASIPPGSHTLVIEVGNTSKYGASTPSGLLVNAKLERLCKERKTPNPRSAIPTRANP